MDSGYIDDLAVGIINHVEVSQVLTIVRYMAALMGLYEILAKNIYEYCGKEHETEQQIQAACGRGTDSN